MHQNNSFKKSLVNFEKIEKDYNKLSSIQSEFFSSLYSTQESLDKILNLLKDNGLSCSELTPFKSGYKDFYKKEYYKLSIEGNFLDVLSFLNDLNIQCRQVKLKKIDLQRIDDNNILLTANLKVVAF